MKEIILCRSTILHKYIVSAVSGCHFMSSGVIQIRGLSGFCIERLISHSCPFIISFSYRVNANTMECHSKLLFSGCPQPIKTLMLQQLSPPSGSPTFGFNKFCVSLMLMKSYANRMVGSLQRSSDSSSKNTCVTPLSA